MSKVGSWSETPGNNNSTPPDGWPEGQAPSTINDCAREMMAQIRTLVGDLQYVDLNNTPSYLSATTFSLGAADTTNFHIGRRLKLFDATTLYGTIDSISSTFVSVRLDTGNLTVSLSSVALAVVSENNNSLPDSTWRNQSVIINGAMEVWQRGSSFSPTNNTGTFTADRFAWIQSSTAAVNISRAERSATATNVPTVAQAGIVYTSSLRISVSAADTTIAAAEYGVLSTKVEGYDWAKIAHRPNVLSFWANSNRTGVYCVALRSTSLSASFVQNYTLSTASTWTHFSITIPEAPTNVTWDYGSGMGVEVLFGFGVGSSLQTGAGAWTAVNAIASSSQTNFLASAANVFMLTGLKLQGGTHETPIDIRPYGDELELCQRYYWRGIPAAAFNFPAYTAACIMSWPVQFPATMRTTPTVAIVGSSMTLGGLQGTPSVDSPTPRGCRLVATSDAAHANSSFTFTVVDYIESSSEL